MQEIVCKKCGYTWQTESKASRISCSKCKTSITLHTPPPYEESVRAEVKQEQGQHNTNTVRITMSPGKLVGLAKAMLAKVKEEGFENNYAIEYDYDDKELYIDLTEEWEKDLMVKDDDAGA